MKTGLEVKGAAMSELTISDFKSKYKPIGLSMELKSQGQSAYETGKIGGHTPLYTDEQIQDYLSNQPQLTIPKSIAEMLDEELNPLERESMLETFVDGVNYLVLSNELMNFVLTGNNYHVISAYLAGKALGVDLVKVVEG